MFLLLKALYSNKITNLLIFKFLFGGSAVDGGPVFLGGDPRAACDGPAEYPGGLTIHGGIVKCQK